MTQIDTSLNSNPITPFNSKPAAAPDQKRHETGLLLVRLRSERERLALAADRGLTGTAAGVFAGAALAEAEGELAPLIARRWSPAPSAAREASGKAMLRIAVPPGLDAASLLDAIAELDGVAWADHEHRLFPSSITPDDPSFDLQWHHAADQLNSPAAWGITTGDPGVVIALCDTGIDIDHPDLLNRLPGYNAVTRLTEGEGGLISDANGHGSRTAGSAAATGDNAFGVAGIAWESPFLPVKVSDSPIGGALVGDILAGARWAADNGARVINVSYSGPTSPGVRELGAELRERDILLVWSAGNEGASSVTETAEGVTVVGAHDINRQRWGGSNTGPGLDLLAPGVGIVTLSSTGGTASATGTSFAAPIVAGAAALVWSADPTLPAGAVEDILLATARDAGDVGYDTVHGQGLLDLAAAVEAAAIGDRRQPLPFVDAFAIPPTAGAPAADAVRWDAGGATLVRRGTDDAALRIPAGATTTTGVLRADRLGAEAASLRADVRGPGQAGPDAGTSGELLVEYQDAAGAWAELARWPAHAPIDNGFARREISLPAGAMHADLRVRFRPVDAAPWGAWLIDDLSIARFDGIEIDPRSDAWVEDFEAGATSPAWSVIAGSPDESASTSGQRSHRLSAGDILETGPVRLQAYAPGPIEVSARARATEPGARLILEERSIFGGWIERASVTPPPAADFADVSFDLSPLSLSNFARVRFRGEGGSVLIDDVRIGIPRPGECVADVDRSGALDIFDVILFIDLWSAGDPQADLDSDGAHTIFDVLALLAIFDEGCPASP
ncbi:MAG: S8 family serine peptidase [Planctomycetota bacterium]